MANKADRAYYVAREAACRELARMAADSRVRSVHIAFADAYAEKARPATRPSLKLVPNRPAATSPVLVRTMDRFERSAFPMKVQAG